MRMGAQDRGLLAMVHKDTSFGHECTVLAESLSPLTIHRFIVGALQTSLCTNVLQHV